MRHACRVLLGVCSVPAVGLLLLIPLVAQPASAQTAAFDMWPDANSMPPAGQLVSLSPLGSDHDFVDLGFNVTFDGREWRALQFTRDHTNAAPATVGRYLFGFVGDEWPARTVEVLDELRRARLTGLVVDGQAIAVGASHLLDLSTPARAAAVYTAFPRFLAPGRHSVQYVWEQKQDFFFVLPLGGSPDPLGLGGRRVFVKGEVVGDTLDGKLVVTYDLNPACLDGVDNDGDALADFPLDPGCTSPLGTSELAGTACDDGADNDGDGLVDFPADPGCAGPLAAAESAGCDDGADNDADGLADFPFDPDCYAGADPAEAAACSDGADNDGDGLADAADSDCAGPGDRVEAPAPECADGADNDGDGAVDYPLDGECAAATDSREAAQAPSQPEDFRLLIALASSGSLNGDSCSGAFTGGDGSAECPGSDVTCGVCGSPTCGNGAPDDSRLHQVKRSLAELFLRTEAEFALLASYQRPAEFACPTASPAMASGGWQGGGSLACAGGFEAARLVAGFAGDNFRPLSGLVDGTANYAPGLPPPPLDAELRASGWRPLAGLLTQASWYLDAVRAGDPFAACRPYDVVLMADGGESCTGDPAAAAAELLHQGIRTHVVGFAVPSGERTQLDAIAAQGGTGQARFVQDHFELSEALDGLADALRTDAVSVERCNGTDDDCDGAVDEEFPGLGQACDNGLGGVCRRTGLTQCAASGLETQCALNGPPVTPSAEVCNGLDDDCDGFTDEQGVCGAPELCNAADDDGDGLVDEDFPIGAPCDDGGVGACRGTGTFACGPDQEGVVCIVTEPGSAPAPADSTCDGRDDDCDGELDENAVGDMVVVGPFRIDRYEASRPDASATAEGRMEHRPCSKAGVLPWRNVTWAQAEAACAAAGKRLCRSEEWELACAGNGGLSYPYGNTYDPAACNGRDTDPETDRLLPAGARSACAAASGAMDMSGNLHEWTSTPGTSPDERVVRGGAFDSYEPGLTCRVQPDEPSGAEDPGWPGLGFRCCAEAP